MYIYRCEFELMEHVFFASREVSDYFQTEAVVGNYALAYALGFCQSEYYNDGQIHYTRDLQKLNEESIYVTPGTFTEKPSFVISRFNALSDSYWFQMAQNTVVVNRRSRARPRPANFPQAGRIKLLAIGNRGLFYVTSHKQINIPSYARLGKFMSKIKIFSQEQDFYEVETENWNYRYFLNPNDLSGDTQLGTFDLMNVKPTPLVRNANLSGKFNRLSDETNLPVGMRFFTIN